MSRGIFNSLWATTKDKPFLLLAKTLMDLFWSLVFNHLTDPITLFLSDKHLYYGQCFVKTLECVAGTVCGQYQFSVSCTQSPGKAGN